MCRRILISAANVPKGNRWHTEIIAIQGYFLCNYPCTEDWLRGTAEDIAVSIRGGRWVTSSRPRQGERFLEPERKRPDRESWVANKKDPPLRDTVTPYHLVKNQKSKYLTSSSSPSYWLHPLGSQRQGVAARVQAESKCPVGEQIWRPGTMAFNFRHFFHAKTFYLLNVTFY